MIIDLRYHLASLAAIFLALGLGLLIGATALKGDFLGESRRQILDTLERQVEQLRRDNQVRKAQVDYLQKKSDVQGDFARQVLPVLVKGRLSGRRIAIVDAHGHGFPGGLVEALETAGAKIQSVTTITGGPEATGSGSRFAGEIALLIAGKGEKEALARLGEASLVTFSGDYGAPPDAVVLVGGYQEREKVKGRQIDLQLIDCFLAGNIPVYGVEETSVLFSSMKDYQKKGISTVDNIDTVPGQVALILAMSKEPGNYGVKSTARRLLPPLEDITGSGEGTK